MIPCRLWLLIQPKRPTSRSAGPRLHQSSPVALPWWCTLGDTIPKLTISQFRSMLLAVLGRPWLDWGLGAWPCALVNGLSDMGLRIDGSSSSFDSLELSGTGGKRLLNVLEETHFFPRPGPNPTSLTNQIPFYPIFSMSDYLRTAIHHPTKLAVSRNTIPTIL